MSLTIKLRYGEQVLIGEALVTVAKGQGQSVKLVINAPKTVGVTRAKTLEKYGISIDNTKIK